jgi:hypothetical protein
MTISGDGGTPAPAPACRPPRYGLRSVVELDERNDHSWAKGLEWDEIPCESDTGLVSGQCPPLEEQRKVTNRGFGTSTSDPFAVYAGYECSTGGTPLSVAWDNAARILEMNWWRTVERAFWTGLDQDGNEIRETLGTIDATDLTPVDGAVEMTAGVAMLESFAGDCFDCEPIVHANKGLATFFAERHLIQRDGSNTRFLGTGTLLAAGGGYSDSGPGGVEAEAGEAWIYVTGGVRLTHGPVFFTPERDDAAGAVDRSVNDVTVYAERFAALQVGCCVGAVKVILSGCCCSTPSFEESS